MKIKLQFFLIRKRKVLTIEIIRLDFTNIDIFINSINNLNIYIVCNIDYLNQQLIT